MSIAYRYLTLRYVHDIVTEEFVNVGVVVHSPDKSFLRARFAANCVRLNAMFGEVDEAHIKATLGYLEAAFNALMTHSAIETADICEVVHRVLPGDDSSLQWSEPGGGLAENLDEITNHLFSRFVERYTQRAPAFP